jgi:ribosomal protein S18 acetylase RimI-like enzyme
MAEIEVRPATDADRRFCFALHEATMREYVAAVWGWDDALQRDYFDRRWDPTITRIVTRYGHDIGIMKLDEQIGVTYLALIEIHPEHQGSGIGRLLIRDVIADAQRCGRSVELDVLSVNTRAQALYRRLGFTEQYRHGDGDIKVRMRREPTQRLA